MTAALVGTAPDATTERRSDLAASRGHGPDGRSWRHRHGWSGPRRPLTVAVTGLNATDNPAPGVGVIRSLRAEPSFGGRIVGLAYDALDSGLCAKDLGLDEGFLIPYPSQGEAALRERLRAVDAQAPLDVIIPTLDSELPAFIALGAAPLEGRRAAGWPGPCAGAWGLHRSGRPADRALARHLPARSGVPMSHSSREGKARPDEHQRTR
jgi:hypothetical protein